MDPEDYDAEKDGEVLVDTEPIEEEENFEDEPSDEFMK